MPIHKKRGINAGWVMILKLRMRNHPTRFFVWSFRELPKDIMLAVS